MARILAGQRVKKVFAAMVGSGTLLSPKQHFSLPIEFWDSFRDPNCVVSMCQAAIAFYLAVMILRLCSIVVDGGRMTGDEEEDDGKDCDSSDDEDDDKRYSLDPSWPQSYRKSMDLYSGVASSSLTRIAILKKIAANPRSVVKSARNHVLLSKLTPVPIVPGKLGIEVRLCIQVATISSWSELLQRECYALAINFQEKAVEAWRGHGPSAHELKEGQCVLHQLKMKVCGESDDNKVLLSTQERRRRSTSSSNVSVE
ncbi:hypothetical protein Tco_1553471 [Tanacetum coccineum]